MNDVIPLSEPCIKGNEWVYIKECLDTGWVSSVGKYVDLFEMQISAYLGVKHAVACVNGTSAIHIALLLADVKPGDHVFVPSLTFIATVNPVRYIGATPVFIDSSRDYYCINPDKLRSKINEYIKKGKKPKAVIPVSLYGHPVDMDPILEICRHHDICVIEDATEGFGSRYKGRNVGSHADISCLSFNGNKLVTTGGGGMIVTDNIEHAKKAKYLTTQARDDNYEYYHNGVGYNYRMTNIASAMGCAQLENIDEFIQRKRKIASIYNDSFNLIEGVSTNPEMDWAFNCCWMYSMLIDDGKCKIESKELGKKLNQNGIQARPFFTPTHKLPMYKDCDHNVEIADVLWRQGLNIPASVGMTEKQINKVVDCAKRYLQE